MTGTTNARIDIDFFALHSRKKKRIDVEMLDYSHVAKCSDIDELKGILALLRSGKEGRYPHLEKTTEDKILTLLPPRERERIERMRTEPSLDELSSEKQALLSWSEQIDAKHKALQAHKRANRQLPPVRGTAPTASLEPASANTVARHELRSPSSAKQTQAIPAYDFQAWEKYDADQALAEIDADDARRKDQARAQQQAHDARLRERTKELAALPAGVVIDTLSREERGVFALNEKHKGNESFKANENDDAVAFYTRSIAFDDTNAVVYANRAIALLRLQRFEAAEHDCSRAVLLDPHYVKGWSRRGMTRFRRGKYADAARDFEHALVLEPSSRELEKLLQKTLAKWRDVDGTMGNDASNDGRSASSSVGEGHQVSVETAEVAEKEPVAQSFTRFAIIEESDDESDEDDDLEEEEEDAADEKPFQRFELLDE